MISIHFTTWDAWAGASSWGRKNSTSGALNRNLPTPFPPQQKSWVEKFLTKSWQICLYIYMGHFWLQCFSRDFLPSGHQAGCLSRKPCVHRMLIPECCRRAWVTPCKMSRGCYQCSKPAGGKYNKFNKFMKYHEIISNPISSQLISNGGKKTGGTQHVERVKSAG